MKEIGAIVCSALLCLVAIVVNLSGTSCDVDADLLCTVAFCSSETCTETPENCDAQNETHSGVWMPSQTLCNCCDYCLTYLLEDDECTEGNLGAPPSGSMCGPGLTCRPLADEDYSTCQRMVSKCHSLQDDYDDRRENGSLGSMEERPECDAEGNFGLKVCVPGQTCFCTGKEGERIFGEVINEKNAGGNMLCGCSRAAQLTEQLVGASAMSLRCSASGSYDPLQCAGNRCFCVNPDTGVLTSTVVVDLQTQSLTGLPCFDKEIHHSNRSYLRECEEEKVEMLAEIREAEKDGYSILGNPVPACQSDGYYSRIVLKDNTKYCVDEQKKQILDFQTDIGEPDSEKMDCNCARTYNLLQKASSSFLPACCSNGNWRTVQCRRGSCYCVDSNGAQKGAEVDLEDVATLPCHDVAVDWKTC